MLEKIKKLRVHFGLKSGILVGVSIIFVIVDLVTKIFEERQHWNFDVIPKVIEVRSGSRNPGCAFSFLAEASWGQPFLIAMTFVLLVVLLAVFLFLPERFTLLKVAISMVVAGAIGNLIDRIAYLEVRDFVGVWMFGQIVACNFADFWITWGTAVAVVDILFINEWALIPLTKTAKEAQAKRAEEEKEKEQAQKGGDFFNPSITANDTEAVPQEDSEDKEQNTEDGGNE